MMYPMQFKYAWGRAFGQVFTGHEQTALNKQWLIGAPKS